MHRIRRRRRVATLLIVVAAALTAVVALGVIGLVRGAVPAAIDVAPPAGGPSPAHAEVSAAAPRHITSTRQPELFARRVAEALFRWDTGAAADLTDWAQPLVDVAEPDEAPAVAADVRLYLPDADSWRRLRGFATRQWLEVESIVIPKQWHTAVQQAVPSQLPPGAGAFTVVGIRHREGIVRERVVASERGVTFTVFVACPEVGPCRLLRLSALDSPLP